MLTANLRSFSLLVALLLAAIVLSLAVGSVVIPPGELFNLAALPGTLDALVPR